MQRRVSDAEYAEARIERQANGCWHWTGALSARGWGRATRGDEQAVPAHRFVWIVTGGVVEEGKQFDHLCHNADPSCEGGPTCLHRRCVNPAHLEQVTGSENVKRGQTIPAKNLRKSECPRGHAYDAVDPRTGWRQCRTCQRNAKRERRRGLA